MVWSRKRKANGRENLEGLKIDGWDFFFSFLFFSTVGLSMLWVFALGAELTEYGTVCVAQP